MTKTTKARTLPSSSANALPARRRKERCRAETLTFEIGKAHEFENLREWFKALYEVLLGQSQGPRFGGFAALYGIHETARLIKSALARDTESSEG